MRSLSKAATVSSSVAFLLLAAIGNAQNNPNIVVEVKDSTGRLVSDARVTLIGPEHREFKTFQGRTDRGGHASFRTGNSGRYVVVVNKGEYQIQQRDINVVDGRTSNVEMRLTPNNSEKILVCVRSDEQNEGLNGISIQVRSEDGDRPQNYTTRSGGFTTIPIQSNPNARYSLQITNPDYESASTSVRSSYRTDQFVVINLRRRVAERSVVIRAIDSESRAPISRARVVFETNDRTDTRRATTDANGTVSIRLNPEIYKVTIESNSHQTETERIDLRRQDSNTYNKTIELRRGNGNGNGNPNVPRDAVKLDGDIRLKKTRFKSGETATADIGVFYANNPIERLSVNVSAKVYSPSGRVVASDDYRSDLVLNAYTRRNLDIRTSEPGTYSIRVTATGNNMRTWSGEKTFTVDREQATPEIGEGIYNGSIDLITLSGPSRSHSITLKVSRVRGRYSDVTGSLGPGRFEGFHIQFKGTFDPSRRYLSVTGELVDKTNKRWDIALTGPLSSSGRFDLELSIRATDNSYNRKAKTQLNKN